MTSCPRCDRWVCDSSKTSSELHTENGIDMSVEGIFRRNGNIRRLRELTEAIDRDASAVDLTQDNPVQLAALLKKFFRDLPDPLMTYKLHRLFIVTQCKFAYVVCLL